MTLWVVADSGLLLATVLEEPNTPKAEALLERWQAQDIQIAAPFLFRYEIVAVVRKYVYRNVMTPQEGIKARDKLLAQPVHFLMDDDLLRRAYELATQFNRPTAYDSQYLAVAEHLNCDFWTADERLFNALQGHLTWVRWLGHFQT
jgi:predicted nucleic acid-binding protein